MGVAHSASAASSQILGARAGACAPEAVAAIQTARNTSSGKVRGSDGRPELMLRPPVARVGLGSEHGTLPFPSVSSDVRQGLPHTSPYAALAEVLLVKANVLDEGSNAVMPGTTVRFAFALAIGLAGAATAQEPEVPPDA